MTPWALGKLIPTCITDHALALVVVQNMRSVVIAELDDSRAQHLAAARCATAGHDPGDEDAGEDEARFDWRPA